MKKMVVLFATFACSAWCQNLDLSSLDKLAAKAKEVNKVSLDHDQLQMALKMMSDEKEDKSDKVQNVMHGLDSIQVRNFEYDKAGEYSDKDLDAVRDQIAKLKGCTAIVDSKEKDEHSQVFMCNENGKPSGIAVISTEPKELSFVFVKGNLNFSDLGKLNGLMGLPQPMPEPNPKNTSK